MTSQQPGRQEQRGYQVKQIIEFGPLCRSLLKGGNGWNQKSEVETRQYNNSWPGSSECKNPAIVATITGQVERGFNTGFESFPVHGIIYAPVDLIVTRFPLNSRESSWGF